MGHPSSTHKNMLDRLDKSRSAKSSRAIKSRSDSDIAFAFLTVVAQCEQAFTSQPFSCLTSVVCTMTYLFRGLENSAGTKVTSFLLIVRQAW